MTLARCGQRFRPRQQLLLQAGGKVPPAALSIVLRQPPSACKVLRALVRVCGLSPVTLTSQDTRTGSPARVSARRQASSEDFNPRNSNIGSLTMTIPTPWYEVGVARAMGTPWLGK